MARAGAFSSSSFAACDSGDFLLNGLSLYSKFNVESIGTLVITGTVLSIPAEINLTALPNGYTTFVARPQQGEIVHSFATCFDNPPLR